MIEAKLSDNYEIEVWGGGEQKRNFMPIDDCLKRTQILMEIDFAEPLNFGSDQLVIINRLTDIVEEIVATKLLRKYDLNAPKDVRARNSDNTLIKQVLRWAPEISLEDGLEKIYRWSYNQMTSRGSLHRAASGQ